MTRTSPPPVVRALIAEVERHGVTVSATQLERWRQRKWLRPIRQWRDPASQQLRAEVVQRAAWLAVASHAGRSISWLGWTFWAMDASPETAQLLRTELIASLRRPLAKAGVTHWPQGDSDADLEARQEAVACVLDKRRYPRQDVDGMLRSAASVAGFQLPDAAPLALRNLFQRSLAELGAQLLIGGTGDVGSDALMDAWEAGLARPSTALEEIRECHRKSELDGKDLMAQSPLAQGLNGLTTKLEQAPDQELCRAVGQCAKASAFLSEVFKRADADPEILRRLMEHHMWDQWAPRRWHPRVLRRSTR
ncbi:hypothetical protein [Streptomyces sp. NPDC057889]|uniref:hypothetical protein n=1 Tax=unclassified Streptomyces TaxID=2593676 RepID=UPI0036C26EF0